MPSNPVNVLATGLRFPEGPVFTPDGALWCVELKGGGLAMSDVFKYVKKLEESGMFENVKTTYTTTKKDKDTEFAEFEISCIYQK